MVPDPGGMINCEMFELTVVRTTVNSNISGERAGPLARRRLALGAREVGCYYC